MPIQQTIRRAPLREALQLLKAGEGSSPLPTNVKSLTLRYVAKNSASGPREFVRTVLPRLAYANPSLSIMVERIRDPRSKSLDPKSPDAGAHWDSSAVPVAELIVQLSSDQHTISLGDMTAGQIYTSLLRAAGGPAEALASDATVQELGERHSDV